MLRLTKVADYGIVLLTHMAGSGERRSFNSRDLSEQSHLSPAMVSKILKVLAREGILESQRGAKGGYRLARSADEISIAAIVTALDGPIAITECSGEEPCTCDIEALCPTREGWQKINQAIRQALENVKLSEISEPLRSGRIPAATADETIG